MGGFSPRWADGCVIAVDDYARHPLEKEGCRHFFHFFCRHKCTINHKTHDFNQHCHSSTVIAYLLAIACWTL
uniref:Uncharacterized protein n=1 Tax=Pararge aegeria TaxID=116150 RepID=S4PBN2_9NEOP